MKFISLILLTTFICPYSNAQNIKTEMPHDTTIVEFTPKSKNVHVILLDTIRLKEDLIVYEPIRKFVNTHISTDTSFGSIVDIDYKQNKLILRKSPLIGKFDSICTRKMVIKIYGIRGKKSSKLLNLEIPDSYPTMFYYWTIFKHV